MVRDQNGNILNLNPSDILSQVEVFGQHEISELAKSPEKRTRLLERFVKQDATLAQRKADIRRQLEQSRAKILDADREFLQVEERIAALPALEETLKRYQPAGMEGRLKEQSLLVREEQILKTSTGRLAPYRQVIGDLRRTLPIDQAFVSSKTLEVLPRKEILAQIETVLSALNHKLESLARQMQEALEAADRGLADVKKKWELRKQEVQAAYEKILRELQKSKVDGEEFIRLRRQIEELRPLRERQNIIHRERKEHEDRRRSLLAEWEDVKAEEFRQLERAAKKVNKLLAERVRVQVTFAGNREPLFQLLKDQVGGRLSETLEALNKMESLSLKELSDAWRAGKDSLVQKYGLSPLQADRLAQASPEVVMLLEELERMFQASGRIQYGLKPVPGAMLKDLDFRRLHDYFRRILRASVPEDTNIEEWTRLLKNLDLMTEYSGQAAPSIDGMLLFGSAPKRFLPQSGIRALCYPGITPDYAARADENLKGGMRMDRPTYPNEVLREAIVNALVHHDYSIVGTDIMLVIYADRLEIIGPGKLPNTVTIEG